MNAALETAVLGLVATNVILAGGTVVLARAVARNKLAAPAPRKSEPKDTP